MVVPFSWLCYLHPYQKKRGNCRLLVLKGFSSFFLLHTWSWLSQFLPIFSKQPQFLLPYHIIWGLPWTLSSPDGLLKCPTCGLSHPKRQLGCASCSHVQVPLVPAHDVCQPSYLCPAGLLGLCFPCLPPCPPLFQPENICPAWIQSFCIFFS